MNAQQFFSSHVQNRLAADSGLFLIGRRIAFDIAGAGAWTLDLAGSAPSCREGAQRDADCTVSMAEADLLALLHAPWRLKEGFARGAIRVTGRMDVAMHLPVLLTLLAADASPSGLDALFPNGGARALRDEWPAGLAVAHAPLERIPELAGLEALASVQALLAAWPGQLRLSDSNAGRTVRPAEALELYPQGYHLAFSDAEQVFPRLRPMLARLRWELQLPLNCFGRCPIYASPHGGGEALHFDQNANFIIQVRGEKLWRVAPNEHVTLPTERYTTAQPTPSPELRIYGPPELPTQIPAGAHDVLLRPGSVLYLPRGHWHQTEATGDSLSLNFTFDQPTWADLLPPGLRVRMLAQAPWRELAIGAASARVSEAEAARQHLAQLVAEADPALQDVDAAALLARLTPTEATEHLLAHA